MTSLAPHDHWLDLNKAASCNESASKQTVIRCPCGASEKKLRSPLNWQLLDLVLLDDYEPSALCHCGRSMLLGSEARTEIHHDISVVLRLSQTATLSASVPQSCPISVWNNLPWMCVCVRVRVCVCVTSEGVSQTDSVAWSVCGEGCVSLIIVSCCVTPPPPHTHTHTLSLSLWKWLQCVLSVSLCGSFNYNLCVFFKKSL